MSEPVHFTRFIVSKVYWRGGSSPGCKPAFIFRCWFARRLRSACRARGHGGLVDELPVASNDADFGKRGRVATITNALAQMTNITSYDAHGQPLSLVDANGLTITMAYDTRQRLASRTVGKTSRLVIWLAGLVSVIDERRPTPFVP